ncbi:MAG: hypothetical protein KGR48_08655 [Alphaproteobacteria bacterium]|nr:hypothetical protein [Alphaproteobacteria bacterium]
MMSTTPTASGTALLAALFARSSDCNQETRETEDCADTSLQLLGELTERLHASRMYLSLAAALRRFTPDEDKAHDAASRAEVELTEAESICALLRNRLLALPEDRERLVEEADNVTILSARKRFHCQNEYHPSTAKLPMHYYIRKALGENGSLIKIEGDACADDATAIARALQMEIQSGTTTIEVWRDSRRLFSAPVCCKRQRIRKTWQLLPFSIPRRLPPAMS